MKMRRDGTPSVEKLSQLRTATENASILALFYSIAPFVVIFTGFWQGVLTALFVVLALLGTMYRGRLEQNRYAPSILIAWCILGIFAIIAIVLLVLGAF